MLILPQKIKTKWNYKTKDWYETKGYIFTKYKDEFELDIQDLHPNSGTLIQYHCDYCLDEGINIIYYKKYNDYNKSKSDLSQKDCCPNCSPKKVRENALIKQQKGILKMGEPYYWYFKENRLKELNNYIIKHGNLDNLLVNDSLLHHNINLYKDNLEEMIKELGYTWNEVKKYKPRGYYDDFNNMKKEIENLINKYGRFPTFDEIIKEGISQHQLDKHGSVHGLKRKIGYQNENDLVDDRGWYNKSSYEYIVAKFLIEHNVPYKREQFPFPNNERNYRSDFTFYLNENRKIHVEVWGYDEDRDNNLAKNYNNRRLIKESLYNKYNIEYISIENEVFNNTYENIIITLFDIFNKYLYMNYIDIDVEIIIPPNKLTNNELFEKIMKFSKNNNILPKSNTRENGFPSLYKEVRKRFGTYESFANYFKVKTPRMIIHENQVVNLY